MAVSVSEIRLEPMEVTFKPAGAGSYTDLGATDGGVEISVSTDTSEITADQFGSMRLGDIITAVNVEITLTLKEVSTVNMGLIFGDSVGGKHTPSGGTEVIGMGSEALFRNLESKAGPLRLVPVGGTANARSLVIHKAYPLPDSISFSGDDESVLSVTFRGIRDTAQDSTVDLWAWGDVDQSFV